MILLYPRTSKSERKKDPTAVNEGMIQRGTQNRSVDSISSLQERKRFWKKKYIGERSNRCAQRIIVRECALIRSGRALIIDIVSLAHLSPLATLCCVTQHRYARDLRSCTSQPRWQSVNNINRSPHIVSFFAVFFPAEKFSPQNDHNFDTGRASGLSNEFRLPRVSSR